MATNQQKIKAFRLRVNKTKNNLIKSTDQKDLIKLIYDRTLFNLKKNVDVNNKKYIKSKWKNGSLLKETGRLKNSIKYDNKSILIKGNTLDNIKANVHNFGKIIKPKNGKYLSFGFNGGFRKVKKVKIPKREFFPNANSKISQESLDLFKQKILRNFK